MEWTRRTAKCNKLSFGAIQRALWKKFGSWPLIFFIGIYAIFPVNLHGQASVVCSSSLASFEQYQPIIYPELGRVSGIQDSVSFELSIMPGGKFDYRPLFSPKDLRPAIFLEEILRAFSGWQFSNNTANTITLKLNVVFEISGIVHTEDRIVKNRIAFDQDTITIRVIATRYIPAIP
jgi:hypothetical protein